MKNHILIPTLILAAGLSSCSNPDKNQEIQIQAPAKVETFRIQKDKFTSTIQLPGELIAFQQVDLYAKVPSFVKELKVDIGSQVQVGDLLVSLEAPELSSQVNAAESRLKSQEALYEASNANYNRLLEAGKTPGTVSQNDIDQANAHKNSDMANLEAARANYKEVSVVRGYLEIRAPFSGVITSRNVSLGAYVGPNGKGSELPLFTLQEQAHLRLTVSIPESYTGFLRNNGDIQFKVKALPATEFKANIHRLAGALDQRLRSERIEMDVDNTDKRLLPGMVAEVSVPLTASDSSFVVPKTAVVSSDEGIYIIRSDNNKAKRIPVKKGRDINDKIEVFGDLKVNEEFVVKASPELREGNVIKK